MPDPHRDPWGRLAVDPARLPLDARVGELRRLAGSLQAAGGKGEQWLGQALGDWLAGQHHTLEQALGVRPRQGSRATAQAQVQREHVARLLRQLVAEAGGQSQAALLLQGKAQASGQAAALLAELQRLGAPTSRRSICRACRSGL